MMVRGPDITVLFGGEFLDHKHPGFRKAANEDKQADEQRHDDTAFEDSRVHEEKLDVHHRTKDQEG